VYLMETMVYYVSICLPNQQDKLDQSETVNT